MEKTTLKKNKDGYGYKYTELAEIHKYLEENNMRYYQTIETSELNGCDYIMTYRFIDGKWEEKPKRGCKVTDATLQGVKNPAQEQGSALTYARRYSLLMAFGLATEDDDAQSLSRTEKTEKKCTNQNVFLQYFPSSYQIDLIEGLMTDEQIEKACEKIGKKDLSEFTITEASSLIKKLKGGK